MLIWYKANQGRVSVFQSADGRYKLWWKGVFGIQIGGWFVGTIHGWRTEVQPTRDTGKNE